MQARKAPIVGIALRSIVSGGAGAVTWATARRRAAGVVVMRFREGVWRVLILRAYRNWDFPKGMLEAGETALDAAKRETRE